MPVNPPGFFGKIPARGDFVSRRLPPLTTAWDAWLDSVVTAAHGAADAGAWPDCWLVAPLWCFRLGSAILPPQGGAGVLVASADRVGRLYPFTVLGASAEDGAADWHESAETLIRGALDDDADPDALDAALRHLGPPAPGALAADASLWWSEGSPALPPREIRCTGLPGGALAATMMVAASGDQGNVAMTEPPATSPMSVRPPFSAETAARKARMAEDAWNTRDPERVALAYTEDSRWRNRSEFFAGRPAIVAFLRRKWAQELDYRLVKEVWAFTGERIAVRFAYEWHDAEARWFRSHGNEQWEFDASGLMRRREASINDVPISDADRLFRWPPGPRPADHPGMTALGL